MKRFFRSFFPAPIWSQLRLVRLYYTLVCFQKKVVQHRYGGFDLRLELADPLSKGWYDRDWPELNEIFVLKQHSLLLGARVFDLGAHQCVVASILAKIVGPDGLVVAVEGNRHNAKAGAKNVKLNELENVKVIHSVVAEKSGTLFFNKGLNGNVDNGSGWGRTRVASLSIDELSRMFGPPDVLFIDVEGYECRALKGASNTLARHPDCFVEVHVGAGLEAFGGSASEILSFFPPEAYSLYVAPPDQEFLPLSESCEFMNQRFFLLALASDRSASKPAEVTNGRHAPFDM